MSHPQDSEAIPNAGSLVGRHLIVREIAKGTIGPLFLARTQSGDDTVDTLARVIPLPADLPARDDQLIAEAIWDSANVGHDMVLRVVDVVAGKGWVTLVHDHHLGALISAMHRRGRELGAGFPPEVAARVALDVLEGLELSQGLCAANRVPWRPGSIALGSLYLCNDGRTRALDGQVIAAVMRSAQMRMVSGTSASVAPELLDDLHEPDERTDVFAVGTILWELLTGREILVDRTAPIADVFATVPKGAQVPEGLAHALHRALELDPNGRQASLRELAVALVMGAEKVATYEQVLEFARALLPNEVAFQPPAQPAPASTEQAATVSASTPPNSAEDRDTYDRMTTPMPAPVEVETKVAADSVARESEHPAPRFASPFGPTATTPMRPPASSTSQDPVKVSEKTAEVNPTSLAAVQPATTESELVASGTSAAHPSAQPLEEPSAAQPSAQPLAEPSAAAQPSATGPTADVPNTGPAGDVQPTAALATGSIEVNSDKPKAGRLEQISWPDDDSLPSVIGKPPASKPNGKKPLNALRDGSEPAASNTDAVNSLIELRSEQRAGQLPKSTSKSAARESVRPGTSASKSPPAGASTGRTSVRPQATKASVPPEPRSGGVEDSTPKKGGLQISMTTLILGFSTTVLAVVLIMILAQRNSRPAPSAVTESHPAVQAAVSETAPPLQDQKPPVADRNPQDRESSLSQKAIDSKTPTAADVKVDRRKRPGKSGANAASKSTTSDDDSASDDSKTTKRPRNYVPSDL